MSYKPKMKKKMRNMKESSRSNDKDIMLEYGEAKKKVRMAFEEIQTTGEYMETHYYKQRTYAETRGKVAYSSFWFDYAQFLLQRSSLGGK